MYIRLSIRIFRAVAMGHFCCPYQNRIVGKLLLIPFAKKILSHLCYWLYVKMKGRLFNVKKALY